MASDRGDAQRGLSLLRRSDAREDDVLIGMLQRYVPRDRTDLGRNDPCWCGSGRKYKVCHRGRETLSLAERVPWIIDKADLHLAYGSAASWLHDLAGWWASSQEPSGGSEIDAVLAAEGDPLVRDVALFDAGGLAAYAEERAALLPDDERALLPELMAAGRGVYAVESAGSGSIGLRPVGDSPSLGADTAAGGLVEVAAASLPGARRGEMLTARLVRVEQAVRAVGAVELVDPVEADGLAAALTSGPSPFELLPLLFGAMPRD